jgi:hypothetical protein
MSTLFDALPGVVMPVAEVMKTLSRMWQNDAQPGHDAPSAFRASQMNLVLQFGLSTSVEEAQGVFDQAITFAQVYPCRIVVLCPLKDSHQEMFLQSKLFSQCYIGLSARQMCCCEALVIGYPVNGVGFLENQVSVWLENDLPVYHWLHRVPARRVDELYLPYLKLCTRVVYDSTVEGPEYGKIHWPKPEAVMDLAYARLLPSRQSLGQFLSSYAPMLLVQDLLRVECRHAPENDTEAENLLRWQEGALTQCAKLTKEYADVAFTARLLDAASPNAIEIEWKYDGGKKHFLWSHAKKSDCVEISADFGKGTVTLPQQVKAMATERVLAEALFF